MVNANEYVLTNKDRGEPRLNGVNSQRFKTLVTSAMPTKQVLRTSRMVSFENVGPRQDLREPGNETLESTTKLKKIY
jgi:hypothetical protein